LLTAIYHDDLQAVDRLIAAGANVRAANREGVTPLAMASLDGNLPIIDRLLKAGADAKARGPSGEDGAHARGAQRPRGRHPAARRRRGGGQRPGGAARYDRADVGR
jgi:ankyrin repeat protein